MDETIPPGHIDLWRNGLEGNEGTVQAFEQAAIARESEDLREHFEERVAIIEHDAGLPRAEAELEAARSTGLVPITIRRRPRQSSPRSLRRSALSVSVAVSRANASHAR